MSEGTVGEDVEGEEAAGEYLEGVDAAGEDTVKMLWVRILRARIL